MPTYTLRAPNGKTYNIEGPPGATEAQVRAEILRRDPDAGRPAKRKPFMAGLESAKTGLTKGLPYALEKQFGEVTPEEEAAYMAALQESARKREQLLPGGAPSFDDLTSGETSIGRFLYENLAQSAPQMGATLAGGVVGGAAGTAASSPTVVGIPVGATAGALLGATAVGTPMFVGSNVDRATAGGQEALTAQEAGRSLIAAPGQALVEGVADRFIPGVGRMLGAPASKVAGGVISRGLRGAVKGAAAEAATEPLQQVGERYAAVEPLTGREAFSEYGDAAATAALLGGVIGGVGGPFDGARAGAPTPEATPTGEAPPAPGDVDAGVRAFAAKYRLDPEDPAVRARVRELMGLPPVEEPVDVAGRSDAGGAEPSVSGDSGGGGGGQPAAEAAVPVVGGLEPVAEPAGQPDGQQGVVDPALTPTVRPRRTKAAEPVVPPVEAVAQPVEAVAQPMETAPVKERRAKAQAAPVDEVVPETTLPPLIQAAQAKAVELFGDDTAKADTFLRGVALEVEGVKLNPPEGKNARDLLNAGRKWYTENKTNVDADTGAVATEAPAAIKTPEPLKVVDAPKMRRTPEGETTREVTLSDGSTVSLFRDIHQFGAHQPVWYVNDPLSADSTEYEGGLGSTLKEALEYLPTRLAQGRARAEAKAPNASPAVPTREIEPVAEAPAAPQPPAEFDTDAVLQQAYEVAAERVARSNQKAFRQGAEEAVGVKPFSAQEDIDKLTPKKRAAYQAGWQFVRDARGEQASPTAISDQAIAEGAKVKKGRTASAQGLKATNRDQVFSRDEVDPEDIAGDLSPEQQAQQAVYAEVEAARNVGRINDEDFATLRGLMRKRWPSSAVREELNRLAAQDKTGREPTREGQVRGQSLGLDSPRYKRGVTGGTTLSLDEAVAEVKSTTRGWKGAPTFEVVDSFDALPQNVRDAAGSGEGVRGATVRSGGRVYVVADQHADTAELRATVFHEALGHAGLAKAFRTELRALLDDIYTSNPAIKTATDRWMSGNPDAYDQLDAGEQRARAVEEVLAEYSEGGAVRLPAFKRALAAVKAFLRGWAKRLGLPQLSYSNNDVFAVLAKAHEQVRGGPAAEDGPASDPRFARAASQSPPTPPGAPPSTPNAPLGGKVEVARMLRSRLDGFTRAVNYKYQDAEATSRELLKALGLDKLADDKDFAKRFRSFEAVKGGGQEILDRRFIKPLEQLVKDLKLDLQDVGLYLWARAAPGRNAMIAKINGDYPDGGSGLTNQQAQDLKDELDAKGLTPALERVAKLHDKLVDHMLAERVAAGLMSQQDVTDIRQEQPFYTPLKGFAADGDMQIDGMDDPHAAFRPERRNMAMSEFRRATGRKSMPYNPLLNLIVDASMVTLRADTNEVGRTFLNTLREFPVEMASVATYYKEKGDTPGKPKLKQSLADPVSGKKTAYAENLRAKGNELMIVKDGGETYFVEFAKTPEGAAMRRAFVNLRPAQMGKLMQAATTTTRVLKQLLTTRSPSYMLGPAFIRDVMDTYASSVAAMTKKGGPAYGLPLAQRVRQNLSVDTMKSVAGYAFGKTPKTLEQAMDMALLEQMIQDGGSVGHALIKSVETYAEDAAKRLQRHARAEKGDPLAAVGEKVAAAGQAMDATAQMYDLFGRFATYKAALELGVSRADAAELALDASLNLTRRGEWSQVLDNLFFFFSPTVEGARKFISMGLSGRNGIKVMTSFAAIGFATTLWNMMMSSDDEDDDGRPDFLDINDTTRQTRMVLYHGRGPDDYVTLPLGFMGAYPQYVGSRIAEVAYGLNSEEAAGALIAAATVDLGRGIFSAMSPVRPSGESAEDMVASSMPNLVKPFFDLTVNRNFFGSPIYNKQYDGRVARSTVGREGTGEFWKWMARSLNELTGGVGTVSGTVDFQPEAYRYLVESFAGGAYRTGRDAVRGANELKDGEAKLTDVPILRGFLGKGSEYVPMSNFYKNSSDLDGVLFLEKYGEDEEWADLQRRRPVQTDPRVLDAFEAASKELDALNRQRREELKAEKEEGNDVDERRAIVDFYREESRVVFEEFNRTYNEVRKELGGAE